MNIIKFFIRNAKVVNLIVVAISLFGGWIFYNGQKEGFPNISLNTVYITSAYFGASPLEIEKLITDKIEKAVLDVDGVDKVTSRSTEGVSVVVIEIDNEFKEKSAEVINKIRSAIDGVRDLPDGATDPIVNEIKFDSFPVINVALSGEATEAELRKVAKSVERDLIKINGVSRIDLTGYRAEEIWAEVDPIKLKQYNLSILDVINAIKMKNITLPGGKLVVENREFLIRTVGQYEEISQVGDTIIRGNDSGARVRVKDVAKISWEYEKTDELIRMKGNTVISASVVKKGSGDIIKVCDAVHHLVDKYNKEETFGKNVRLFTSDDMSFFVKRRLNVLGSNLLIGLALIFGCLIIFLDWRTTLWTTLGIPVSFAAAMLVANAMGITLNLMSMFGFIIVIGMIVDDSILVAENIFRHKEMGKDPFTAAVDGTSEVVLPILGSISTTIVAFSSLLYISGIMGDMLSIIPKVVAITILASLVECLFVLPGHILHTNKTKSKKKIIKNEVGLFKEQETVGAEYEISSEPHREWMERLKAAYGKAIELLLRKPKITITIVLFLSALILVGWKKYVPFEFFPTTIDEFQVIVELSADTAFPETTKKMDEVEKVAEKAIGKYGKEIITTVGFYERPGTGPKVRTYLGAVRILLHMDRKTSDTVLLDNIKKEIEKIDNIKMFKVRQVKNSLAGDKPISVTITGQDLNDLRDASIEIEELVLKLPNVGDFESSFEEGKDEIALIVDESVAAEARVSVTGTAMAVRYAFEGGVASVGNSFKNAEEDVEIKVKYNETTSKTIEDLDNVKIPNAFMKLIPLKSVAQKRFSRSAAIINHEEGDRIIYLTAELKNPADRKYTSAYLGKELTKEVKTIQKKYPDLVINPVAAGNEQAEMIQEATFGMLVTFILIYIILVALFKSFLQPVMVMIVIPFGFVGVSLGLLLHYVASLVIPMPLSMFSFSFMSILGLVALSGVVVNNSLIIISFINYNRRQGLSKIESVVEAGKARLRPIILTTLTTMVGLVPIAYSLMGNEPFIQPMAIALIWGLMFGTVITLFILPCIYILVDGSAEKMYKLVGKEYGLPPTLD